MTHGILSSSSADLSLKYIETQKNKYLESEHAISEKKDIYIYNFTTPIESIVVFV